MKRKVERRKMKKLDELLKQEPVYLNDWTNKFGVVADFEDVYMDEEEFNAEGPTESWRTYENWLEEKRKMQEALKKYENRHILFASYGQANYSGDAWVLFEEDGKLYEVNGSHCSCNGLEGQWDPEEVTLEEIEYRLLNGTFGFGNDVWAENVFRKELIEFLGIEEKKDE